MINKALSTYLIMLLLLGSSQLAAQEKTLFDDTLRMNLQAKGHEIQVQFLKGETHNHPLMAIWIEDTEGNYIQTIYVNKSIADGIFTYGEIRDGRWEPGEKQRPAALPVWGHKRGVRNSEGNYLPTPEDPVADAYSGPTPSGDFLLIGRTDQKLPDSYCVFLEINQPWDWNEFWTNDKYPSDEDYMSSSQPALVYRAEVNPQQKGRVMFELLGHNHYSGDNGEINTDLSTISTAGYIAEEIWLIIP